MQDVYEEKRSCRKAMRRLLAAQERSEAMKKSNAASLALISLDAFKRANIVMAYMAMKHECNPEFAVKTAIELGKTVVFPRCIENGGLELYAASRPEDFSVGAYGIVRFVWHFVHDLKIEAEAAFERRCRAQQAVIVAAALSESNAFF